MADLGSRIVVLALVAFCLWIVLLTVLRGVNRPLAGLLAAVLSWAVAGVSAAWVIAVLRRAGLWPLV